MSKISTKDLLEQNTRLRITIGKLDSALSPLNEAIAWTDMKGNVEWCNDSFARLCNRRHIETIGVNLTDLLSLLHEKDEREVSKEEFPIYKCNNENTKHVERFTYKKSAGNSVTLEFTTYHVQNIDGSYFTIIIRDITGYLEKREQINYLSKRIAEYEKNADRNKILSAIRHNIGNTLTHMYASVAAAENSISSRIFKEFFLIIEKLCEAKDIKKYIENNAQANLNLEFLNQAGPEVLQKCSSVRQEITRIATGMQNIKDILSNESYLQNIADKKDKIRLVDLIDSILEPLMTDLLDNNIVLKREYNCSPMVHTYKSVIYQIITNFIVNACESLNEIPNSTKKRKIIVVVKDCDADKSLVDIAIYDNGIGMEKSCIKQIFNEGFSTKAGDRGVGLSTCKVLAASVEGTIEAKSEGLNKGATFTLRIPKSL